MGLFDGVVKLIGATGNITTSVTARGSKGAVAVEILDASGNQITQFGGDEIGLLDADDVRINPATNEKLDEVIAGLGNITIDTSVLATEATLTDIKTSVQLLDNAISGNEIQVDVITLPGVAGDVAHDTADSGNPVKIGFKSASPTSLPTATTVGDRTNLAGSTQGEAYTYGTRLQWDEDETNELGRTTIKPISANTYNLSWDTSTALEASSVVKASAGNAYVAHVFNNNAATRYFQVYNSTTVPADTAVPIFSIPVATGGYIRVVFGLESGAPYHFSTGISWANSTTYATKTVGGSDFWVNFGYM